MEPTRRFAKKSDLLVIAALLAAALLFTAIAGAALRSDSPVAEIYIGSTLYRSIELAKVTETQLIELDAELHVTLEVSPGAIRFFASDCPDKLCVNTGRLTQPPDYAACLPARVSVKIVGGKSAQPMDAVGG